MKPPQITILIRTSNRPELFQRCIDSIIKQTLRPDVIVSYDNDAAVSYIPPGVRTIKVTPDPSLEYFYDLYCNDLMHLVDDGWMLFVDDDDYLISPTILEEVSEYLTDPDQPVICQFLRYDRPKPNKYEINNGCIKEGKVGLPCIILHAKHKYLAQLDGKKSGDYRFIKAITDQLQCKFLPLVLVDTDRRSFGKMEEVKEVNS